MMEKELFDDLVQSLKEAKAIARGEAQPSRRFSAQAIGVQGGATDTVTTAPDPALQALHG